VLHETGDRMVHDVTSVIHKGGYLSEIEFDGGRRGLVDFSKYLTGGGVFERFKDPAYFATFRVDEEVGTRSGEADELHLSSPLSEYS
jgi:hypothetical protein